MKNIDLINKKIKKLKITNWCILVICLIILVIACFTIRNTELTTALFTIILIGIITFFVISGRIKAYNHKANEIDNITKAIEDSKES